MIKTVFPAGPALYSRYDRHGELFEQRAPDYIDVDDWAMAGPTAGGRPFVSVAVNTADGRVLLQMETRTWRELAAVILEKCDRHESDALPPPNTAAGFDPGRAVCPNSWQLINLHLRNAHTVTCRGCGEVLTITAAPDGSNRLPIHNDPEEQ